MGLTEARTTTLESARTTELGSAGIVGVSDSLDDRAGSVRASLESAGSAGMVGVPDEQEKAALETDREPVGAGGVDRGRHRRRRYSAESLEMKRHGEIRFRAGGLWGASQRRWR